MLSFQIQTPMGYLRHAQFRNTCQEVDVPSGSQMGSEEAGAESPGHLAQACLRRADFCVTFVTHSGLRCGCDQQGHSPSKGSPTEHQYK